MWLAKSAYTVMSHNDTWFAIFCLFFMMKSGVSRVTYGMKIGHFGSMKVILYCSHNVYVGFRVWNKMCGDQNLLIIGIIGMPQNLMVDQI